MTDLAVKDPIVVDLAVDKPAVDHTPVTREGNPGLLALPLVIAGGFGLGLTNTGIVDVAAAAVPILLSATAVGLLLATIWAAVLSQNVNATVYGVFFGFYASYAALSLGLTNDWFGIGAADVGKTTALWLGSWLVTIGFLTVPVAAGHRRRGVGTAARRKPHRQCGGDAGGRLVRLRLRRPRRLLLRRGAMGRDRRTLASAGQAPRRRLRPMS